MDNIHRQVRRIWRRLALQQFLFALGWCWFGALLLALVIMAIARFRPVPTRDSFVLAVALGVGFIAAIVAVWRRLPRVLTAAWEIDRRFALKERISSTLAMNSVERESDAGQALMADADARLKRINLNERFSWKPPRQVFLPLLPALLALLITFRPAATPPVEAETIDSPAQQAEVKKAVSVLRDRLSNERQKTEKSDLAANELLKKIENGTKEILAQPNREKALVKLNQLENLLKDRQKQLGGGDAIKRQLEDLKNTEQGPADKLAKAMARGDFEQAADALEKLKQQLAKSGLDEKQKEKLARQFEDLKRKLDKMAEQASDTQADLQKRADQMSSAGDAASAQKLQDQIDKMMQNPQSQSLQQLADALGRSGLAMKQGDNGQASSEMQQALNQLNNLAKQSDELATVDNAMRQIASARNRMNCPNCGGAGCKECQGEEGNCDNEGNKLGMGGGNDSDEPIDRTQPPGDGLGRGLGKGTRPENKANGKFYDSSVKQNVTQGAGMVTDMVEGPNLKGHALAEIQKESMAVQQGTTDPLSGQRLPKEHSKFAREYFDRVRDDK